MKKPKKLVLTEKYLIWEAGTEVMLYPPDHAELGCKIENISFLKSDWKNSIRKITRRVNR